MWRAERGWLLVVGSDDALMGPCQPAHAREQRSPLRLPLHEADTDTPLQRLAATLRALAARAAGQAAPGTGLRVLVSDRWLATATLPWSADLLRPETGEASAKEALLEGGASLSGADVVRVDDAPYRALRCALAYPAGLLAALEELAVQCGMRIETIQPLAMMVAELQRGRAGDEVLAVMEPRGATIVQRVGSGWLPVGGFVGVDDPASLASALEGAWRRAQLRLPGLARHQQLPAIDLGADREPAVESTGTGLRMRPLVASGGSGGDGAWLLLVQASARRLAALDAVGRAPRPPALAWVALAAAGLLAATVMVDLWSSEQRLRDLRRALAQKSTMPGEAPRRPVRTRDDMAREGAINAAIDQLNLPAEAMLAALVPPRDVRVALTGADVLAGGGGGTLRLTGEALTVPDMTRYVDVLSDRRPIERAHLTSHELIETGVAGLVRFTVEATWRD